MNTQHIQINVPLNFKQVVDIVKQLSPFEKKELSKILDSEHDMYTNDIPCEHKQIVRDRIKKYEKSPEQYLTWNDVEKKMSSRT